MSQASTPSVTDQPSPSMRRLNEIQRNIALLKCIRQKTLGLRVLSDGYDRSISIAFLEALHKIESSLAALLLERELWISDRADQDTGE